MKFNGIWKRNKRLSYLIICQIVILAVTGLFYIGKTRNTFSTIFSEDDFLLYSGEMADGKAIAAESVCEEGTFLRIYQPLMKGSYQIRVNYLTDTAGNGVSAASDSLSMSQIRSDVLALTPGMQTDVLNVTLSETTDDFFIQVLYGGLGQLEIFEISLWETNDFYKRFLIYAVLLCALLALLYAFLEASAQKRQIMLGLSGIFLFSCYPLFVDYMIVGHDLPFHLLRIEGIYHGLRQGVFPVKIHPVWAQDYGYAVGVFYGDAALYFPALLRFFGFSVQTAYKFFVAAVNLGTVMIAYYSFRKMFSSEKIGLLGSLLYTFSLYRLSDMYTRASVGEYTALMFMPLVLCGFYLAFTAEKEEKRWWQHSLLIIIGLTGVIQSHVLSCEMLAMFLLPICLILAKRVFRPSTFKTLSVAAGFTIALNLGFLIPFLDYFKEPVMINSPRWIGSSLGSMQEQGMFPVQLFGLFHPTNGGSWAMSAGVNAEASYPLGFVLVAGMLLFIYLAACHKEKLKKGKNFVPACYCFGLGALALYMSTCYFPWGTIASWGNIFKRLVNSLEFPWRFLSIATLLFVYVSCYVASVMKKALSRQSCQSILAVLSTVFLVSTGWYYYDFTFTGEPYRVYDTCGLNSMAVYSGDYLMEGTDLNAIHAGEIRTEGDASFEQYRKEGTTIRFFARAGEQGGAIDFPLSYYKNYCCRNAATGELLEIGTGHNKTVQVKLPPSYSGECLLNFREPWYWRAGELFSVLTVFVLGGCILYYIHSKRQENSEFQNNVVNFS